MKKFLFLGAIMVLVVITSLGCQVNNRPLTDTEKAELAKLSFCSNEKGSEMGCSQCLLQGGKITQHSFSNTCAIESKDAGRACTYDNECVLRNCVYLDRSALSGRCDGNVQDNDGRENCHRPRDKAIVCESIMS